MTLGVEGGGYAVWGRENGGRGIRAVWRDEMIGLFEKQKPCKWLTYKAFMFKGEKTVYPQIDGASLIQIQVERTLC